MNSTPQASEHPMNQQHAGLNDPARIEPVGQRAARAENRRNAANAKSPHSGQCR